MPGKITSSKIVFSGEDYETPQSFLLCIVEHAYLLSSSKDFVKYNIENLRLVDFNV